MPRAAMIWTSEPTAFDRTTEHHTEKKDKEGTKRDKRTERTEGRPMLYNRGMERCIFLSLQRSKVPEVNVRRRPGGLMLQATPWSSSVKSGTRERRDSTASVIIYQRLDAVM